MAEMVNQRKKHFAEERAKAKRNKPMTQSQLRIYMSNYLKNLYVKLSLKNKFNKKALVRISQKSRENKQKRAKGNETREESSSKRAGDELEQEKEKKQKVDEDKETAKLQSLMKIIPDERKREEISKRRFSVDNLQGNKVLVRKLFDPLWSTLVKYQSLHVFMLVEKRYPLTPATITKMLNKKLQADHWNEMCYQLLKLITILRVSWRLLDEKLSQEDVNQRLLRSLSPEWNTHAVVWRNRADLDTMSISTTISRCINQKLKDSLSSSTQNMDFVSSSNNNTSSTYEAVNAAIIVILFQIFGVSTTSTQVNAVNSTNIDNLSDAVICAFC
ncbi:hypothetical protein Tco_1282558 [Tanacetum coccineum]